MGNNNLDCAWCGRRLDGDTYIIARGRHFCSQEHYHAFLDADAAKHAAKHREAAERRLDEDLDRWGTDGGMIYPQDFEGDPEMEHRSIFRGDDNMDIIGRG